MKPLYAAIKRTVGLLNFYFFLLCMQGIAQPLPEMPDPNPSPPKMYGMTQNNIFSMNPDGSDFNGYFPFTDEGRSPNKNTPIKGSDGKLYGMTSQGGSMDLGVIFSVEKDGTGYSVLQNFNGTNGRNPQGGLTEGSDGKLYGMTAQGGSSNNGTIFSITKDGSDHTVLANLNWINGGSPQGSLTEGADGMLYGMTYEGGSSGYGVIFSLAKDGSNYTVLQNLNAATGMNPMGGVTEGNDGKLYGLTYAGGSSGYGVIFSVGKDGNGYTILQNFTGSNGRNPYGSLIEGADGKLYGMTSGGGINSNGVIFSVAKDGSGYMILQYFSGTAGRSPFGQLAEGDDGRLYGMTGGGWQQ